MFASKIILTKNIKLLIQIMHYISYDFVFQCSKVIHKNNRLKKKINQ